MGLVALMSNFVIVHTVPAEPIVHRTENNNFSVRLVGLDRPARVNRLYSVDMFLKTADGKPAAGASFVVTGQHRYAFNPLPTSPRVVPGAQDGAYRLEGLRFHIAGQWRLTIIIDSERIHDRYLLGIQAK
ncbi:MAG: hypothetical protein AB7S93_08605 [Xanthobacteraceae bacterium]